MADNTVARAFCNIPFGGAYFIPRKRGQGHALKPIIRYADATDASDAPNIGRIVVPPAGWQVVPPPGWQFIRKGGRRRKTDHDRLMAGVADLARERPTLTSGQGAKHIETLAPGVYKDSYKRKLADKGIGRRRRPDR